MIGGGSGIRGEVTPEFLARLSRLSSRMESNRRPTVFKWWGRRPLPLVRAFIALAVGADAETALQAAEGSMDAVRRVRSLASGLKLLDPFSGSGVIPIEASRLGLEAVGQDINPYAHALATSASDLCTGACRVKADCLWTALARAWQRIRGLWCLKGWCIIHVLLARCPPCTAPRWVSSRRGRRAPKEILVIGDDGGLEWRDPRHIEEAKAPIHLPKGLPEEADGYVAYALEVYRRGEGRRWISLIGGGREGLEWRRFLEETGGIARRLSESLGGIPVPLMEETRRLYRHGRTRSDKLYTWRQNTSYREFLSQARNCGVEAGLAVATASPSTSLLAIYYQPLAKVNPGMVVKSYWLPRNPVELNPFSHEGMPNTPSRGAAPVGRGTLVSVIGSYTESCGVDGCTIPPSFTRGDSRETVPGRGYDIVATDPPYPGLQTYKDLSLFYAHAAHLAGKNVSLSWEEIDTRDLEAYRRDVVRALRISLSRARLGARLILFISSPSGEGIAVVSDIIASLENYGAGVAGVYPVVGEARGTLGRAASKLVYVVYAVKGADTSPGALKPLEWTEKIVRAAGLRDREREHAIKLSRVFHEMLRMKMKAPT